MAASILLKRSKDEQTQLIEAYGLSSGRIHCETLIDDVLVAIIVMVGSLFAFNYLLYQVLAYFSYDDQNPVLTALRLSVSALIMHGGAAVLAFFFRDRPVSADAGPAVSVGSRPRIRKYFSLGTIVYVAVYFGLMSWALVAVTLSPKIGDKNPIYVILSYTDLIIAYAVLSLAPVVSAICAMRYIEVAEQSPLNTKTIAVLAGIQGGLTAFIVLVSSQIQAPTDRYFIVTSCLNGLVIGATLGAAILKLASKRKRSRDIVAPMLLPSPTG